MIQTTIRLPEKLHEQIKKKAKEQGISINSFIITVLWKGKSIEGTADFIEKSVTDNF